MYSDDSTTEEESGDDRSAEEESQYSGDEGTHPSPKIELGEDETWFGKTRVGLHGQIDPEDDPDRTDPLTLSEAFGSRILRDHLLIGAMESSLLDPFTPRQRGLVCLISLVVTGLLTCIMVKQSEISSELVVVGSTLASFTVSIVLQHIYEEYQPRVRTVVPYLDERTGQYGLAKLSEAEGVANDIKEAAAEQKRKVTLEESRRRKRLQERARRRSCQVSTFSFVLLGAAGGLGYLGYEAALRVVKAGELEPVFWCAILSLIGQFVILHTLKVLLASLMAVMSDHRTRRKLERSRTVGMHSESAAEALAARLGKPPQPKRNLPAPPPHGASGSAQTQQSNEQDSQEEDQVAEQSDQEQDPLFRQPKKNKPAPPPRRADQQARVRVAKTEADATHDGVQAHAGETVAEVRAGGDIVAYSPAGTSALNHTPEAGDAAPALGIPTPSAAATALPPLATPSSRQQATQETVASSGTPIAASVILGTAIPAHREAGVISTPSAPVQAIATPTTPAPRASAPLTATPGSAPKPARAPASVPRPARKAPASVPRPPRR